MKRIIQVLTAYVIFVCAAVLTVSFLYRTVPELLPGQGIAYRINRGLLWFMEYLPAAMISGILVGCSIAFGRNPEKSEKKYSQSMFERYRTVMFIGLVTVFLLTLCMEIITPLLQNRRTAFESAPKHVQEYVTLARDCLGSGRTTLAFQYIAMAHDILPSDSDITALYEDIGDIVLKARQSVTKTVPHEFTEAESITGIAIKNGDTTYTVNNLLERADAEFAAKEYFNAHYFASLAAAIAQAADPNGIRAKQLAADAWNELEKPQLFENDEMRRFYARKKKGYNALIEEDYLTAYYTFSTLARESIHYAADPDVRRYLEVALQKLSDNYFFIDETQNLDGFKTAQNIYFCVPGAYGRRDIVYIKNMYTVRQAGGMIRYLHGVHIFTYNSSMQLERSLFAEYAKMSAFSTSAFDEASRELIGIDSSTKNIPHLMLISVDRDIEGRIITPEIQYYSEDAEQLYSSAPDNYYLFTMPYEDIELVASASVGSNLMYLPDLFKIVPKAERYGFSFEAFNQALIRRVVYPLFLLILILFVAVLGWNYRINQNLIFRFAWIFGMPFFSFFVYILFNGLSYMFSLINCAFAGIFGTLAMPAAFVIYAILLIAVSVLFLSRKADGI